MKNYRLSTVLIVLSILCQFIVPAVWAEGRWAGIGPEGNSISTLAVDLSNPMTLYVGTDRGEIFRSIDGGMTWLAKGYDATWGSLAISALAIDPSNSATLYMGVSKGVSGRVYKSTDGGETKSLSSTGLPDVFVNTLVIDPVNPAVIYAGIAGGVFKSTDRGEHWQAASSGLPAAFVDALAIASSSSAVLYAAMEGGVYKSTDGGGHWQASSNSLSATYVNTLVIDPSNPAILYAGAGKQGTLGGLFKSIDGGKNWHSLNNNGSPDMIVKSLVIASSNPAILYAGTFDGRVVKSTDGGGHWSLVSTDLPSGDVFVLAIAPYNPAKLYAGIGGGVYKSIDGGEHWSPANAGLPAAAIDTLAIAPSNPATFYAISGGNAIPNRLFKSTDGGRHWDVTTSVGLPDTYQAKILIIDPANPATLYLLIAWNAYRPGAIFKSIDGGQRWDLASKGLPSSYANVLAIDPLKPSILYVGTEVGVYKSTDGGEHWNQINDGLPAIYVNFLAIAPSNPATLYTVISGIYSTGSSSGSGIYKSTDGGGHWNLVQEGGYIYLAINPSNPSIIYSLSGGGGIPNRVFKSTDGGKNWNWAHDGLDNSNFPEGDDYNYNIALIIDPSNPATLYAKYRGGLIFKSTDSGGSWYPVNYGIIGVNSLVIDPSDPATLYAGTYRGVHKFISATDCLFNWVEKNYASLFAPSEATTMLSEPYTYRYYATTNTYLGVSSIDNHAYYMRPDGILRDAGLLSDWLPLADCQ